MDITYYLFATYVFLLVCTAIWFFGRVMRRKHTKEGGDEKERQLFRLYQNVEDMLGGFEEYAEEAKTAIDDRLKEAEAIIKKLGQMQPVDVMQEVLPEAANLAANSACEDKIAKENETKASAGPDKKEEYDRSTAVQAAKPQKAGKRATPKPKTEDKISEYMAQGMDRAQIAKALGKSQREISLMMEIKKINSQAEQN